jgi:hypothetical protein
LISGIDTKENARISEDGRLRTRRFQLKLFDQEMQILQSKADKFGMSKSALVRDIILFGNRYVSDGGKGQTRKTRKCLDWKTHYQIFTEEVLYLD